MKMHASVVFIIFAIHCRFRQRFRLTKDAFRYVLSRLDFSGHMSSSIPAVLQLASTLSLLASGSFQHTVGNDFLIGMSQSATCRVVQRVAKEMELKLCPEHINFSPDQSVLCMEHFCTKFWIPGGKNILTFSILK